MKTWLSRHPAIVGLLLMVLGTLRPDALRAQASSESANCLNSPEEAQFGSLYGEGVPKGKDYAFDVAFDRAARNGSFSCDANMRASEARRALEAFRAGVLYRDATLLSSAVPFPFDVNLAGPTPGGKNTRLRLRNAEEWFAMQSRYFTKDHLAIIACAHLGAVSIVEVRSGFYLDFGSIMFRAVPGSPRVRVAGVIVHPADQSRVDKACRP